MTTLTIKVEKCIDSDDFVWSLLAYDGGVYMDGYEATEWEAMNSAKEARSDVYQGWLESEWEIQE